MQVVTHKDYCPYCGELIELIVDDSVPSQEYIEDCFVCCQPINVRVWVDEQDQQITLTLSSDHS